MIPLRPKVEMGWSKLTCEKIEFVWIEVIQPKNLEQEEVDFISMMSDLARIYDDKLNLLLSVKCHTVNTTHLAWEKELGITFFSLFK